MKKIIASIAAASVLVAGAFVASSVTSSQASAQTDETPAVTDEDKRPHPGGVLEGVLSDLVTDGTLTQAQADAVTEGVATKRDELKEEFGDRKERRARRHDRREQIQEWLSDGVISADELAELPDDSRIFGDDSPFAEALEDGQITQAEWDAVIEQHKADREAKRDAQADSTTS